MLGPVNRGKRSTGFKVMSSTRTLILQGLIAIAGSVALAGGVMWLATRADDVSGLPAWSFAALLLRVSLGLLFIAHLYWKFALHPGGFATWWSNFASNGYPIVVPYYVVSAEIAGALFLIPGIHTRWVSLYAVPLMLGAAHFWFIRKGFFFTAAGCELPLVWALMLLVQSLLGDGAYALNLTNLLCLARPTLGV